MENILEIKDLSMGFYLENKDFDYDFYYALNDINLSFEKGKIHALAGESGCGKSVLINSILRLLPKNALIKSGEITYFDKNEPVNLLKIKEKDFRKFRGKKICLIPQDPFMSLNPLYTIENQLLEVFENKKNHLDEIKTALEKVKIKNINNVLKSYPHELSGGMKQRVIIAMSLTMGADLILADEPTTALDVSVSNSILEILNDLKNEGKTIILITHDLSIVKNYCDNVNIMYLGNVVEKTTVKEFFKNPLHPYSVALLEALPNDRGKKLKSIKGNISPINEIIEGCKFHPRCERVMDICKFQKPEAKKCASHEISCHLYD